MASMQHVSDLPLSVHVRVTVFLLSCADAIFATHEVIARNFLMCLYDLQKACDSVEY